MLGKYNENQNVPCAGNVCRKIKIWNPMSGNVKRNGGLLNKTSDPTLNYKDLIKDFLVVDRLTNLRLFPQIWYREKEHQRYAVFRWSHCGRLLSTLPATKVRAYCSPPDRRQRGRSCSGSGEAHAAPAGGDLTAGTHCFPRPNNYVCWVQKVL